ncbi:GNAT family N-acetyltransferase [Streptomyces chumphonensis]|uniref:Lysine N-acyltransferase MbtK n=1 Tax=Streptomyces chumphonensis TaxID=1214925 RepID=A0A927F2D9_9ACTN|nr:GNAT family N-acetyltransferase [Streptomyces chumphonensis]MBD3933112.1 acetyltransferase [Streptomyces chumphonensis]
MNHADIYPVLPRHRIDGLPESWLGVPPPPTGFSREGFHFREAIADRADIEMIHAWMNRPHTAKGWEYDWPLERWEAHIKAQLATAYSRPIVVERKGRPIAYMEFYRMAQDVVGHHYQAGPYDLSFHLAIADPADTGGGLGTTLLGTVIAEFFERDPRCDAIVLEPDAANGASRRMIEKNDAVHLGDVRVRHRHIALYAKVREGRDLPRLLPGHSTPV